MASIRILDPIVASRIAAGEVVERPASVLRELLDNSIDAGATKISVYLEQGGIKNLTVTDNGSGMSEEDLLLSCESHATSKVKTLDDLFSLKTLGFRGEALSSISSCSKLTIDSNSKRIVVDNGEKSSILPGSTDKGTSVSMEDLFENIPARKIHLKRPQSEAAECKKVFIEKALGFPEIEFLLFSEGTLVLHLPKADRQNRCVQIMKQDRAFMPAKILEMSFEGDNEKLYAISSDPSCYRRDRGQIKVFVNNRIIDSYQLVLAITNAYSAALPGGAFPYFYLFIEDNPALVDFNIHPAKRECKLRNQSQIYGAITNMIRNALIQKPQQEVRQEPLFPQGPSSEPSTWSSPSVSEKPSRPYSPSSKPFDPSWFENAKTILAKDDKKRAASEVSTTKVVPGYRYIGQLFNTFLLVELDDKVLFIDQHALHERLLYDEIKSLKDVQRLIVPYEFEVERSVDDFLQENSMIYADFGIELTRKEPLLWEMASMPAACRKNEEKIVSFIREQTGDIESAQKGLFAIIACHAAIKAGDELDSYTAKSLVEKCFELDRMVCPHGREFSFSITKEELFKRVGRIV
ncbi:MAG: DNA mismatch repair endonuclease MutL [Spirochaetales bacterium]|nr:DNA mismatch repair endonuclease MutL [Spirochaetales bacterium]MBO6048278.1 DNA mismatch repair endonuclease MutL [Spirochaetales bacterium]